MEFPFLKEVESVMSPNLELKVVRVGDDSIGELKVKYSRRKKRLGAVLLFDKHDLCVYSLGRTGNGLGNLGKEDSFSENMIGTSVFAFLFGIIFLIISLLCFGFGSPRASKIFGVGFGVCAVVFIAVLFLADAKAMRFVRKCASETITNAIKSLGSKADEIVHVVDFDPVSNQLVVYKMPKGYSLGSYMKKKWGEIRLEMRKEWEVADVKHLDDGTCSRCKKEVKKAPYCSSCGAEFS